MAYSDEITADSPVAWWRCRDASGTVADETANGNDATSTSGNMTYSNAGPISSDGSSSKAIYFEDVGTPVSHQDVPDSTSLDVSDVVSIETWFKRTRSTQAEWEVMVAKLNHFGIGIAPSGANQDKIGFVIPNVATLGYSTVTVADTDWHHVVATKAGATMKIYLDGDDVTGTMSNTTMSNNTNHLFLGVEGTNNATQFDWYLSEVAIYSTALSAGRVLAHFEAASAAAAAETRLFGLLGIG